MSGREDDDRLARDYVVALERLRRIPDEQRAGRESAEREARSVEDAALRVERTAKDRARAAAKELDDAASRVARLVARSSAEVFPAPAGGLPERLGDVEAALRPLVADLRSAESSWEWVERTRRSAEQAPAPRPAPSAGPSTRPTPMAGDGTATSGRTLLFVGGFAVLALAVLLVIIFSF